jgi:hypothetical protein
MEIIMEIIIIMKKMKNKLGIFFLIFHNIYKIIALFEIKLII